MQYKLNILCEINQINTKFIVSFYVCVLYKELPPVTKANQTLVFDRFYM